MARGQRDFTKEHFWRRHLDAWRHSGLSVRDYCAAQQLAEASFYSWRRTLQQRHRRGAPKQAATDRRSPASPFLPVRIVPDTPPAAAIEVVLRGGRVLRLAPGFTAATLRELLAVLEDLPC